MTAPGQEAGVRSVCSPFPCSANGQLFPSRVTRALSILMLGLPGVIKSNVHRRQLTKILANCSTTFKGRGSSNKDIRAGKANSGPKGIVPSSENDFPMMVGTWA